LHVRSRSNVITTELCCNSDVDPILTFEKWTRVIYICDVISIKTIFQTFDVNLKRFNLWKTFSKCRMFVSFMKISACWLLHRLIKFNKICWEKRPIKPRPNMRTSFWRCDLKNTQPHLNTNNICTSKLDLPWRECLLHNNIRIYTSNQ